MPEASEGEKAVMSTKRQPDLTLMTPDHPRWEEFAERLEGPGYCNFRKDEAGRVRWDCGGGRDKSHAIRLLGEMGFTVQQIVHSCEYFTAHGGYCDCEIIFNVQR